MSSYEIADCLIKMCQLTVFFFLVFKIDDLRTRITDREIVIKNESKDAIIEDKDHLNKKTRFALNSDEKLYKKEVKEWVNSDKKQNSL